MLKDYSEELASEHRLTKKGKKRGQWYTNPYYLTNGQTNVKLTYIDSNSANYNGYNVLIEISDKEYVKSEILRCDK